MRILVEHGYSALEAIEAATVGGAAAVGREDLGRIAPGCQGDLVLLDGDPSLDHTVASDPVGVLISGEWVYRSPAGLSRGVVPI
jgi:imidazolonepropionase